MSHRISSQQNADVRMRGFLSRATVDEALRWIDRETAALSDEITPLAEAHDRVLAVDMTSAVDI